MDLVSLWSRFLGLRLRKLCRELNFVLDRFIDDSSALFECLKSYTQVGVLEVSASGWVWLVALFHEVLVFWVISGFILVTRFLHDVVE